MARVTLIVEAGDGRLVAHKEFPGPEANPALSVFYLNKAVDILVSQAGRYIEAIAGEQIQAPPSNDPTGKYGLMR